MPTLELHTTAAYMVTVGDRFDCTFASADGRASSEGDGLVFKDTSDVDGTTSTVSIEHAKEIIAEPYAGMGGELGPGPRELLIWPPNTWSYVRANYKIPEE